MVIDKGNLAGVKSAHKKGEGLSLQYELRKTGASRMVI